MLTRRLNNYTLQTRDRRWDALDGLTEITGRTMGIVGMGGIGSDTAYRAYHGFTCESWLRTSNRCPSPDTSRNSTRLNGFPKWCRKSMCCCVPAPHTPITHHMFNDEIFRLMKPTAYFINVSRGWLVDSPALASALRNAGSPAQHSTRRDPEPLPADDPLWTAGNIIITSHTSARSAGSTQRCMDLFCENVRRYVNGVPLLNVVDKQRGY